MRGRVEQLRPVRSRAGAVLWVGWFLLGSASDGSEPPLISEFLANGKGDSGDWIELFNPNPFELSLGGYELRDDTTSWKMPQGAMIPAGGFFLIHASGLDLRDPAGELHTNFKLGADGDSLSLVADDGATILQQFSWDEDAPHPAGRSYGIARSSGQEGFFAEATPGAENSSPFFIPERVWFSDESRTFTGSLSLSLESPVASYAIRYTLDGSEPTASSLRYGGPLEIDETTIVRARFIDPESEEVQGDVSGRHFVELGGAAIPENFHAGVESLAEFSSNLPLIILDNAGGGESNSSEMRTTTLTVIEPVEGVASLSGPVSVGSRAGYRIRGASSRAYPKKQYRLEIRNQDDEDKDVALLGLPADSDWVLSAPFTDKALIRNAFVYGLGQELGLAAPRTEFVELFVNEDGGALDYATDYRGVYLLTESVKISKNRLNLKEGVAGDPETSSYVMKWEFGNSAASRRIPGWGDLELVEPDPVDEATPEQQAWIAGFLGELDGVIGTTPAPEYDELLDVSSYANLFVINELTRNQDAYVRSAFFHKDSGGRLMAGPLWDYDLTMGNGCCRDNRSAGGTGEFEGSNSGWQWLENTVVSESKWEESLVRDADFWQAFVDRWQLLRQGILSDAEIGMRMDRLASPLSGAAVRNFSKWDNLNIPVSGFETPLTVTWEEQIGLMKAWLKLRAAWLDRQFVALPILSPGGGEVAGTEGTVYYTFDGTDPRAKGGGVREGARASGSLSTTKSVLIARGGEWEYLDDGGDPGDWKDPLFDGGWSLGPAPLGYGAGEATTVGFGPDVFRKYPTTYFRRGFEVTNQFAVTGLEMEGRFDDGALVFLNGREVARINLKEGVVSFGDFAEKAITGTGEDVWHRMKLDPGDLREGRNLIAIEVHQDKPGSSDLVMDFSLTAEGPGSPPLDLVLERSAEVTARILKEGRWSAPVSRIYVAGERASAENFVVSEIHYHPASPNAGERAAGFFDADDFEFVELMNVGAESIDLSGVHFSEGVKFWFPAGTELGPQGRVVVVKNRGAFLTRYPEFLESGIAGVFSNETGLSNGGERITILGAGGETILSFKYDDSSPWPRSPDGEFGSLVLRNPASLPDHRQFYNWRASVESGGNPLASDGLQFGGGGEEDFLNYAMGGAAPEWVRSDDGGVEIAVPLNLRADDVAVVIEVSSDLANWSSAEGGFEITEQNGGALKGVRTYRMVSPENAPQLYLRARFGRK